MNQLPRICSRCVMDETASNITFDAQGVCNFCSDFADHLTQLHSLQQDGRKFDELVAAIKKSGKGKAYDCVVGVSGGVDSSYVLHLVVQAGLRPLAVHLDNGWNSELAVANINALVSKLSVDLFTHVIDWSENRDLQLSMFKAGVVDIELLMDNAMLALNYQTARRYRVRHIIAGTNRATEGIRMPKGWNHFKLDAVNIRAIQKRFGKARIRSHPLMGTVSYVLHRHLHRIDWVSLLDYVPYDKEAAIEELKQQYGYKPYPYKHYESVFTRYYQGFILPRKFGVDKRKVHLSTLVMSGQMTREEALADLQKPPYDPAQLQSDQQLVLKKLGLDEAWLADYLEKPGFDHLEYPSEQPRWEYWLAQKSRLRAKLLRA